MLHRQLQEMRLRGYFNIIIILKAIGGFPKISKHVFRSHARCGTVTEYTIALIPFLTSAVSSFEG